MKNILNLVLIFCLALPAMAQKYNHSTRVGLKEVSAYPLESIGNETHILVIDTTAASNEVNFLTPNEMHQGYTETGSLSAGINIKMGDAAGLNNNTYFQLDDNNEQSTLKADSGFRVLAELGINEYSNGESLNVIGSQAAAQGGFKTQYTYSSGNIIRAQFGGLNIGSELGVGSNTVQGHLLDYISDPNYPTLRTLFMQGNFLAAGAQKNFGSTIGIFNPSGSSYAASFAQPLITNDSSQFFWKAKAINPNLDHAHFHLKTLGYEDEVTPIGDYGLEALVEINAQNDAIDRTRIYVSPHQVEMTNLVKLSGGYAAGDFVPGYTHTDDAAKTGTAATVLSEPRAALALDSLGYVMAIPDTRILRAATLALDAATISTANTGGGVEIIPAPPAGYYINITAGTIDYVFNTTAFDGDQYLRVVYSGNTAGTFDWLHAGGLVTGSSSAFGYYRPNSSSAGIVPGVGIKLIRSAGSTVGDGSAVVRLFYTIEKR